MPKADPTRPSRPATAHEDGRRAELSVISEPGADDAGDLACWASLVCIGCGGVTTDPGHDLQHRRWLATQETTQ